LERFGHIRGYYAFKERPPQAKPVGGPGIPLNQPMVQAVGRRYSNGICHYADFLNSEKGLIRNMLILFDLCRWIFYKVGLLLEGACPYMPQNSWSGSQGGVGGLSWMECARCRSRASAGLAWFVLILPFVLATEAPAGNLPLDMGWQNMEFRTYAPDSIREIADCKIEKIFLDHRKLGFFRVKLLPVLVVQGVRLELAGSNPTNDWPRGFQSDWMPDVKRSAVEWRDVDITVQKENAATAPSLHADRAQPEAAGNPAICSFKGVTLEAGGAKWLTPQAELRNENGRPFVVWQDGGGTRRMDLFSGEIFDNSQFNGEKQ
jgi:hypothetical protein